MNEMFMYRLGQKRGGNSGGGEEWIGDGNTHIWITLHEGRTSPMLGVGVKGTVTVDWGDGSAPDTLKGTSISTLKRTAAHEYGKAGDYVITLSGGEIGILGDRYSSSFLLAAITAYTNTKNNVYLNAVKKFECGTNLTEISLGAFYYCHSLESINISNSATSISNYAFSNCYSLASISIPDGVTSIGDSAFSSCSSLANVSIPDGVTSIGNYSFQSCYSLASINIPDGVTSIGDKAFYQCYSLASISIPDGVTSIGDSAFRYCHSLASINISDSVTSIGDQAFGYCYGAFCFDFTKHTAVPTLTGTNAFQGIPDDCQIRVPVALVDEWKAATNWSTYADKIVGV